LRVLIGIGISFERYCKKLKNDVRNELKDVDDERVLCASELFWVSSIRAESRRKIHRSETKQKFLGLGLEVMPEVD